MGSGMSPSEPKSRPADCPGNKSRNPRFRRGERAYELSAAAEVKFGLMKYDNANKEVVRRYMSRHDLVISYDVRASHQAALIDRAMTEYFTVREDDLVQTYTVNNKRNIKRIGQLGLLGW
jgi:hypothetical protein